MSTATPSTKNPTMLSVPNRSICAHCTAPYSSTLRSTKKFIVHNPTTPTPSNPTSKNSKGSNNESKQEIKVGDGMIEILNWRRNLGGHGQSQGQDDYDDYDYETLERAAFARNAIDPNVSVCQNCGLLIAKLYSIIQGLKTVEKPKDSYFGQFIQKFYYLPSKANAKEESKTRTTTKSRSRSSLRNTRTSTRTTRGQARVKSSDGEDSDHGGGGYYDDDYGDAGAVDDAETAAIRAAQTLQSLENSVSKSNSNSNRDEERPFRCSICNAGFFKETHARRHLLLSHDVGDREKSFHCQVPNCFKSFYFAYQLRNHESSHSEAKNFHCPEANCSAVFKCKNHWFQHRRYVHPDSQAGNYKANFKTYTCKFCHKKFKESRAHRNHEEYVHVLPKQLRRFQCKDCGKTYHRKDTLRAHNLRKCKPASAYGKPGSGSGTPKIIPKSQQPTQAQEIVAPGTATVSASPIVTSITYTCSRKCGQFFSTKQELDTHDSFYCSKMYEITLVQN